MACHVGGKTYDDDYYYYYHHPSYYHYHYLLLLLLLLYYYDCHYHYPYHHHYHYHYHYHYDYYYYYFYFYFYFYYYRSQHGCGLHGCQHPVASGARPGRYRGVMRTTRHRDQEFEAMLQALNLVVLNSWTSASPRQAHTFSNGQVRSQIDVIAVRRPTADRVARSAKPVEFDLAPWRQGPKHRALVANIPWHAGWLFGSRAPVKPRFTLQCLRQSLKLGDARAQRLQEVVRHAIASDSPSG